MEWDAEYSAFVGHRLAPLPSVVRLEEERTVGRGERGAIHGPGQEILAVAREAAWILEGEAEGKLWWVDAEGSTWVGELPQPGWRGFTGRWTGLVLEGFFESMDVRLNRGARYWEAGEWHARATLLPEPCEGGGWTP